MYQVQWRAIDLNDANNHGPWHDALLRKRVASMAEARKQLIEEMDYDDDHMPGEPLLIAIAKARAASAGVGEVFEASSYGYRIVEVE